MTGEHGFRTLRLRPDEAADDTAVDDAPDAAAAPQPEHASPREIIDAIGDGIAATSSLWERHVIPAGRRDVRTDVGVDELLARLPDEIAFGVQVIYEGFLLHEGRSRVLHQGTPDDERLLIGDYCHATGITDLADVGAVAVIDRMARTIAMTATAPAEQRNGIWATSLAELITSTTKDEGAPA